MFFTHRDLSACNIMVDKGHVVGILDWQGAGCILDIGSMSIQRKDAQADCGEYTINIGD
jgi:aminoglycoside phosphotransferase (APT) family kinase protein